MSKWCRPEPEVKGPGNHVYHEHYEGGGSWKRFDHSYHDHVAYVLIASNEGLFEEIFGT